MKTKSLLKQLKIEADEMMPDIKDKVKILAGIDEPTTQKVKAPSKHIYRKLVPILSFVLVLALGVFAIFPFINQGGKPTITPTASVVLLEVNPKFEISSDKNEKVAQVRGLNKQAIFALNGKEADYIGKTTATALEELLKLTLDGKYIKENITVTAAAGDSGYEKTLNEKLKNTTTLFVETNKLTANVNSRGEDKKDKDVKADAKKYGISETKIKLCYDVLVKFPKMTLEELAKKDTDDLLELLSDYDESKLKDFNINLEGNLKKLETEKKRIEKELEKVAAEVEKEISDLLALTDLAKINKALLELNNHFDEPVYEDEVTDENLEEFKEDLTSIQEELNEKIAEAREELKEQYIELVDNYHELVKNGVDTDDDFDFDDFSFNFELDIDIKFSGKK